MSYECSPLNIPSLVDAYAQISLRRNAWHRDGHHFSHRYIDFVDVVTVENGDRSMKANIFLEPLLEFSLIPGRERGPLR